jgi:hypothetical protein
MLVTTKQNQDLLNDLHEVAKPIFFKFLEEIYKLGYDIIITGVYYSYKKGIELNKIDARNPVWNAHTFGLAVDLNIVDKSKNKRYMKATPIEEWKATGVPQLWIKLGYRWGGNAFSNYYDPIHFDILNKYNISKLKEKAITQFGNDPDNMQCNRIVL